MNRLILFSILFSFLLGLASGYANGYQEGLVRGRLVEDTSLANALKHWKHD